jgi:hypothetical protein
MADPALRIEPVAIGEVDDIRKDNGHGLTGPLYPAAMRYVGIVLRHPNLVSSVGFSDYDIVLI